METKHALITGGAGFIGSHLSEFLLGKNWKVTVLDDLSTGSINNIKHLEKNPDFKIFVGSAADKDLMHKVATDVDTVFHLAAVVGVKKVMQDTVETIEKNLHTTETVLQTCNLYRLRLLTASTSEVYGANNKEKFSEEDDAIIGNSRHRRWCYAAGKLLDEFHAYAYFHSTALPVTILRFFNTIGPRQVGHYGMVVPTFVNQALKNEPIVVFGDGKQRRCFTDVRDVVRSLYELSIKNDTAGEVFNIGSDQETSIMQLAEKVKEMTGSESPIILRSYEEVFGEDFVDMERRMPDTSKLRAAIGFAPETKLDDILKNIIDWMRSVPDRH